MDSLISLEQIEKGLEIKQSIDKILKSYKEDGSINTSIIKTPAEPGDPLTGKPGKPAVTYTLEEYLEIIKKQLDSIIAPSGGSTDDSGGGSSGSGGGIVHLASQIGTKCAVLFGQSPLHYYGYKNNINIQVGKCQGCVQCCKDVTACLRKMDNPECMELITADIVLKKIEKYLDKTLNERT